MAFNSFLCIVLVGYSSESSDIEWDELKGGSGSDHFVLGDYYKAFYAFKGSGQSDGWARLKDWDGTRDKIVVHGNSSEYQFIYHNWGGTSGLDTGIFYDNNLIGIVEDSTNLSLDRDFIFHDYYQQMADIASNSLNFAFVPDLTNQPLNLNLPFASDLTNNQSNFSSNLL